MAGSGMEIEKHVNNPSAFPLFKRYLKKYKLSKKSY